MHALLAHKSEILHGQRHPGCGCKGTLHGAEQVRLHGAESSIMPLSRNRAQEAGELKAALAASLRLAKGLMHDACEGARRLPVAPPPWATPLAHGV